MSCMVCGGSHKAGAAGCLTSAKSKPQNPTVEITVSDLQAILKHRERCTPGEAAARVGAIRRAEELIRESS